MYYWVFKHRLVNESASMDISLHPHAVRVMKTDDIPISLQQAARQHLIDVECVRVSQKELGEAQERVAQQREQINKLLLDANGMIGEHIQLHHALKDANAKIDELTKCIVKLALICIK